MSTASGVAVFEGMVAPDPDKSSPFNDLTVTTAPEAAFVVRREQICGVELTSSELVTEVVLSVPKATVPPSELKVPAQAVADACEPTSKVIEGLTVAVIPTWSLVTVATAKDPVMPAAPANVTVFEPAEAGLVPVKPDTVSVPAPQPLRVSVNTFELALAVSEPLAQLPVGEPAKAEKLA
jgi:hypothetical protein